MTRKAQLELSSRASTEMPALRTCLLFDGNIFVHQQTNHSRLPTLIGVLSLEIEKANLNVDVDDLRVLSYVDEGIFTRNAQKDMRVLLCMTMTVASG